MANKIAETIGPYIVWTNYGVEGWKPKSYDDLTTALLENKNTDDWLITKSVDFEIKEK